MNALKTFAVLAIVGLSSLAHANRESGAMGGGSAVYVRFTSLGSGIDTATLGNVEALIDRATVAHEVKAQTYELQGREGERLICVDFIPMTMPYQFIKEIAPGILADQARVGFVRTEVAIGDNCGDPASATPQDLTKY